MADQGPPLTPQQAHDEAELLRIWRAAPEFSEVHVTKYRGGLSHGQIIQSIKPAPLRGTDAPAGPGALRAVGDPARNRLRG